LLIKNNTTDINQYIDLAISHEKYDIAKYLLTSDIVKQYIEVSIQNENITALCFLERKRYVRYRYILSQAILNNKLEVLLFLLEHCARITLSESITISELACAADHVDLYGFVSLEDGPYPYIINDDKTYELMRSLVDIKKFVTADLKLDDDNICSITLEPIAENEYYVKCINSHLIKYEDYSEYAFELCPTCKCNMITTKYKNC